MEPERLVRVAMMQLVDKCLKREVQAAGTVLMDAPPHTSKCELEELAGDKQFWNAMCNALQS
jgi:hypothetical protein